MLARNTICMLAISVLLYIIWKEHDGLESERKFCVAETQDRQQREVLKSFRTQDAFIYKSNFDVSNNILTVNQQIHPSSYQPAMRY